MALTYCPGCGQALAHSDNCQARRSVTSVGWDGASNPMYRYTDELDKPDHMRSIVASIDRPHI